MPKMVEYTGPHFPGTVVLIDPFPPATAIQWEAALLQEQEGKDGMRLDTQAQSEMLPVILNCVEEWHLQNVPEKPTVTNFPFSPLVSRSRLIAWLVDQIMRVYIGDGLGETDPNGSGREPLPTV